MYLLLFLEIYLFLDQWNKMTEKLKQM